MKAKLMSLAFVIAGVIGAGSPLMAQERAQVAASATKSAAREPARQHLARPRLFRQGDLAALAQAAVPPSKWTQIQLAYELQRLEPVSEADRAEFAEKLAKVTAPDAVDLLMAEIEPKLIEARPQVPGALLMGFGAMQMAVASPDSELTDEQRAALESALPGIQGWATSTDFLSSSTLRDALTLLTDAARRSGITSIDQLKAMPLEDVLDRASTVLVAAKDAVRLYGIDLDAVADSLRVEVLKIDGSTARVRTTVTVFEVPVWTDHDLVLVEGRWYGKDAIAHWSVDRDDEDHDHDVDG
jgi:hypothetical protein